jgi:exodeoxyribonuclease VII large subunit
MDMEKEFIDLFEFQSRLKRGVESLFPNRLWIRAEVSAVRVRSGHCYLEMSQSDKNGLIAKATAIIWSSKYRLLAPYFESVTGSPLQEGMVILAEVQPTYSQLYGFSLIINDIDPEYSLGLKELERQKTIERLQSEGLMDRQKALSLPALPYDLAVISAADAAGYRDFMRHLDGNPYGFKVNPVLYPALMQGADCPASVVAALEAVMQSGRHYDAVLIMRGGGSKLDLACFDDYDMASAIARCPIPVLTGVGHDHDFHVCDMVAYEYVKTPTALADYLLEMYEAEDERLSSFETRIRLAATGKITNAEAMLQMLRSRIRGGFALKVAAMESALKVLETRIVSADPRKVIERGYALAVDADGRVVKGAAGRKAGDKVSVMFADGVLDCRVEESHIKDTGYGRI